MEEAVHTSARCNATRYSESTLFSLCLARLSPSNLKDKANRVTEIVEEAQSKCNLWHKIFLKNFFRPVKYIPWPPRKNKDGIHCVFAR